MWHIKVPATAANLGSGFDTLGLALSLSLDVWFSEAKEVSISVRGEGQGIVPEGPDNLVWRTAATLYREVSGKPIPPGRVTVKSRIPLARGLGSSAAAIVAGLTLANTLLPKRLSREELLAIATRLEGHPDNVAAAIYGGFILAWDDQGAIRVQNYPAPDLRCLLLIPDYRVSTEDARRVLPASVPIQDAVFNAQRLALWIDAVNRRDWSHLRQAGEDRLHQPYRQKLVAGMGPLIEAALSHGAAFSALSGSGPTILSLVPSERAMEVAQALTRAALEVIPGAFQLHDVTPSSFGAECVLDSWQWRRGGSRRRLQLGPGAWH
ncbi:homoserine kinase [Sulfobacillus harzensis]|uniref:Homoserine kinase n=1 Tax=Sulfobacillus harzensis TaxID=2729629 RepID=A0A7Y0L258_9FIRM|nr:homoserine kinase [Sulfobacillus harzensis]NMP21673.1 homoserine kinase [Sulfobacillus harzensis]